MSITKDFEKQHRGECEGVGYLEGPVHILLAHTRALEAMLKKHEWNALGWCLECKAKKHAPNCQLAKLLEGVEEQATEPICPACGRAKDISGYVWGCTDPFHEEKS